MLPLQCGISSEHLGKAIPGDKGLSSTRMVNIDEIFRKTIQRQTVWRQEWKTVTM
jgi:hypothetical protein